MTLPSWGRAGLVLFVLLMLQLALVNDIRIWGTTGSVMVVAPIAAGLVGGPDRGALVGFAAGLSLDVFLTTPFGLTALVWTITGYAVGALGRNLIRSSVATLVGIAALAAPAATAAFVLVGLILGQDQLLSAPVMRILVVNAVVAGLVVAAVVPAMRWALTDPHDPVHARH